MTNEMKWIVITLNCYFLSITDVATSTEPSLKLQQTSLKLFNRHFVENFINFIN
jgi:hypothetical protein